MFETALYETFFQGPDPGLGNGTDDSGKQQCCGLWQGHCLGKAVCSAEQRTRTEYFLLRDLVVTEMWLGGHKITWSIKKKCRLDNQLGSNIINIYTSVNDYKINYYNNIYFFL